MLHLMESMESGGAVPRKKTNSTQTTAEDVIRRLPEDQRFFRHVNQQGPPIEGYPGLGLCWLWEGAKTPEGYGVFERTGTGKKRIRAHRYSYELVRGGTKQHLKHLCEHLDCVNPLHVVVGVENPHPLRSIPESLGEMLSSIPWPDFSKYPPIVPSIESVMRVREKADARRKRMENWVPEDWGKNTWDRFVENWTPEQQAVFDRRKERARG